MVADSAFLDPAADEPAITDPSELRAHRKRRLALAYQVFGAMGWGSLGDGHISARDPERLDCRVEVQRRRAGDASWLFVLNHTDDAVTVAAHGTDIVSGVPVSGSVTLPPCGVAVVREGGGA